MSLQNRWTSFDDPDRWIVRFGEDLELYLAPPHRVDRGQGKGTNYIPDYWNDNEQQQSRYETIKPFIDSLAYTPNTELTYPNYWDDTDYMQHRIIGPMLLTVHESPVLQPGTYSRIPRISQWEAPGHILTEEQVQKIPLRNVMFSRYARRAHPNEKNHIRDLAQHIPAQHRVPAAGARHGNSPLRPGDRDVGGVRHGIVGGVRPKPEQEVEEPTR